MCLTTSANQIYIQDSVLYSQHLVSGSFESYSQFIVVVGGFVQRIFNSGKVGCDVDSIVTTPCTTTSTSKSDLQHLIASLT
jgi:hypothetical protein